MLGIYYYLKIYNVGTIIIRYMWIVNASKNINKKENGSVLYT